ncbi:MAG: halocarboxylic acid dehydrogenase DehI family protein [Sandaracinaceae bacterium]
MGTDVDELETGAARIRALGEVMPHEAPPGVAGIYDDIQATLGVPFVNFIFRMLATRPAYLTAAWSAAAPALRSSAFATAADELRSGARAWALLAVKDRASWADVDGGESLRRFTATIHHVLPKLLLVATALHEGRLRPAGAHRPAEPQRLPEALALPMVDPASADAPVAAVFERILRGHGHPGVASYYRALGAYPAFLEAAWGEVEPLLESASFARARHDAIEQANAFVHTLLDPHDEPPHAEELRPALAVFRHRLIPDLLLDVSVIQVWMS